MRSTVDRAWTALCAGRPVGDVACRFLAGIGLLGMLYAGACLFLILEPVQ